jgi:hypothetical protein
MKMQQKPTRGIIRRVSQRTSAEMPVENRYTKTAGRK